MYEIFSKLLQKHGVTPYKVSKDTGIPQSTLSDWKRGVSTPKNDKLQKIANYFNVSLQYLTTGIEPETVEIVHVVPESSKDERQEILNNLYFSIKEDVESDELSKEDLITIADMFIGYKKARKERLKKQNK